VGFLVSLWVHPGEFAKSKVLTPIVQGIDYPPCIFLDYVSFTSTKKVAALVFTTDDKHHAPFNDSDHGMFHPGGLQFATHLGKLPSDRVDPVAFLAASVVVLEFTSSHYDIWTKIHRAEVLGRHAFDGQLRLYL